MAFVAFIVVLVVAVIVFSLVARSRQGVPRGNRKVPALQSSARVVNQRSALMNGYTQYYATFELPDGQRLEFAVDGRAAGQLVVGDNGTLLWQGTIFRGFQREIMR